MTAEELVDELVRAIRPPKGIVITLREFESRIETDKNWIPGTGEMPLDALERYGKAVAELGKQHPHVDWEGVQNSTASTGILCAIVFKLVPKIALQPRGTQSGRVHSTKAPC
jgi:hypothetical protein